MMKPYSEDEFEKILREQWQLTKTGSKTKTATFWKTKNGKFITAPHGLSTYFHYMIDAVATQIQAVESITK